jgi:GntR family transcriptional regulator
MSRIDRQEQTDLFEQVAAEIRRAIADGEAKSGERLPPARELAAVLGVNTNTVLRSLRLLRDEGVLEFRRGRGIHVAGTLERGAVLARARELARFARQQGYLTDELIIRSSRASVSSRSGVIPEHWSRRESRFLARPSRSGSPRPLPGPTSPTAGQAR